jgi:hypothetical protein
MVADIVRANILLYPIKGVILFFLCNQSFSLKVYQFLSHCWWFSPGTSASSTTKTGHHDIAEILLKVALNTINQINQILQAYLTLAYFDCHFIFFM